MSAAHSLRVIASLARDFARFAGRRGYGAFALMVGGAALEGLGLMLIVPLVAVLAGDDSRVPAISIAGWSRLDRPQQLAAVLVVFVAAMAARAAVMVWRDRALAALQADFVDRRRLAIVEAIAGARWRDVAALRHARIVHAMGAEMQRIATALRLLLAMAAGCVLLTAQLLVAALLAPALAGVALAILVLSTAATLPVWRRAGDLGEALRLGGLTMADATGQLLGGLKLALAQNLQAAFVAQLRATTGDLAQRQRSFLRAQGLARIAATTAAAVALALAVWIGATRAMPVATLAASLAILARMFGPAMAILRGGQQLATLAPAYTGLVALQGELARAHGGSMDSGSIVSPAGVVALTGVCYRHPQGGAGIVDATLAIAPGEMVGIAGASGAGKTTLLDLLSGLIAPDSGTITVGGRPFGAAGLHGWRDTIGYVAQDSFLFNDTIRRNLCWGIEGVEDAAVWDALDVVGAAPLVRAMRDGLDTMADERGGRLSGGERQRLALARALIRRPALLLLDEATGALDPASEAAILARLAALDPRPAIVLVSHRAQALAACDRIVQVEAGRIAGDVSASRSPSAAS